MILTLQLLLILSLSVEFLGESTTRNFEMTIRAENFVSICVYFALYLDTDNYV